MNVAFCSYIHLKSACVAEYVKCVLSCKTTQHTQIIEECTLLLVRTLVLLPCLIACCKHESIKRVNFTFNIGFLR